MIIPIDDKYRIKSDVNQWMLQRFRPASEKREESWESFKYFHDPSNAVTELIQLQIREADTQTLTDALVEVDRITTSVLQALSPHLDVTVRS